MAVTWYPSEPAARVPELEAPYKQRNLTAAEMSVLTQVSPKNPPRQVTDVVSFLHFAPQEVKVEGDPIHLGTVPRQVPSSTQWPYGF